MASKHLERLEYWSGLPFPFSRGSARHRRTSISCLHFLHCRQTLPLSHWESWKMNITHQGNANYNCNELSLTGYPLECRYYFDWQYHELKKMCSMSELAYTAGSISNGSPWVKHLGGFLLSWTHSYPKTQYLSKVDLVTCYMSPFIRGWDPAPLTTPSGPAWLNGSPCPSGVESSMWKCFSSCLL